MNREQFATLNPEEQEKMLRIFGDEETYARSLPERLWVKSGNCKHNIVPCTDLDNPRYCDVRYENLWMQELHS